MAATRSQINLLPQELRGPGRLRKVSQILKNGSFIFLGVYMFVLLLLFGGFLFFSREESRVEQVRQELISDVENLETEESLLVILKDRLGLAKGILVESAEARDDLVDKLLKLAPPNIELTEISGKGGGVVFVGVAPDSATIKQLFTSLEREEFTSVILDSLALRPNGSYGFSVRVQ